MNLKYEELTDKILQVFFAVYNERLRFPRIRIRKRYGNSIE